ncbi:MAG: hypothetical protein COT73_11130 [Bdellovibrio sp. CG10_big_fil_rev_8_21_14_0_10_47_8]|nr:MAG: hypothetical protein COT73_11130 [Bdellovibrio sp. CG10_big_fil_rev_8_21_14_0_10_47_8]
MSFSRWALFLSGRGSNAEALFEMFGDLDIAVCVSSRKNAYGLKRAERWGVPSLVLDKNPSWQELTKDLRRRRVNRIFLLGFMKILPAEFVQDWQGQIWNLHPSMLPAYPGKNAIEASYQDGASMGVTIHEVTAEMDAGPRLLQFKVAEAASDNKKGVHHFSLAEAKTVISQAEQRLVRELARRRDQQWI